MRSLIITLGVGLLLTTPAWAQDLVITLTPNAEQLAVFGLLINQECQRLIAGEEGLAAAPGFCTVTNHVCTCTPNAAQLGTAVKKLFLDDGYQADKQRLYNTYGEELTRRFKGADKAARDACADALGLPRLP